MKTWSMLVLSLIGVFFIGCGNSENLTTSTVDFDTVSNESLSKSGIYRLDTGLSVLRWKGTSPLNFHKGTVFLKNGTLTFTDGVPTAAQFVVDMQTVSTTDLEGDAKISLDNHLRTEDFFDVPQFPEASFMLTSATKTSLGQWKIEGDLTIKDITNSVSFILDLIDDGTYLIARGPLIIDRTLWDMQYNSSKFTTNLGDKLISDEIEFDIEFFLKKQ